MAAFLPPELPPDFMVQSGTGRYQSRGERLKFRRYPPESGIDRDGWRRAEIVNNALENRYARKGIGGSNPSPSANHKAPVPGALWLVQAGVVDEPRFGTEPAGKAGECQRRALSEAGPLATGGPADCPATT
jgi:hypothetical protein